MPVLAGSPVTAIVRPCTLTPGRPAAAARPAGRRPRAGVSANRRAPAGVTTRTRPDGVPSARPRATLAGTVNATAVAAARLSTRSRSALPAVVRYWRAVKRVAQPATRSVVRRTRLAPVRGRSVAARTWRPALRLLGGRARRYGARVAARSAWPSRVYATPVRPVRLAGVTVTTTGLDGSTATSARTRMRA